MPRRFWSPVAMILALVFVLAPALPAAAGSFAAPLSQDSTPLPEGPVVVRIYQLKDRQTFDRLVYQQLLEEGDILLAADLLASRDVVIGPGGDASLNMPLEAEATFVAVVGLFRHPDTQRNTWKQVLAREELDPDKPRIFTAEHNQLRLRPEAAK